MYRAGWVIFTGEISKNSLLTGEATDTIQLPPTDQCAGTGLHGLIASINNYALFRRCSSQCVPILKVVKIGCGHGFTGLDFNRLEFSTFHLQAVNFFALAV